jgi:hypothetical protein
MSDTISGEIVKIGEVQEFSSGSRKVQFVIKNNEGYNDQEQVFAFDLFAGASKPERLDYFLKYNQVGSEVDVSFNIKCNEYKGKYYTNLDAWRVDQQSNDSADTDDVLDEEPPF